MINPQELNTIANMVIEDINIKLKNKKVCAILQIGNFCLYAHNTKNGTMSALELESQKIGLIKTYVDYENMVLQNIKFYQMDTISTVECDFLNFLLPNDLQNNHKVVLQVYDLDAYQLVSVDNKNELYVLHFHIDKVGHLLVLYDDIQSYFTECEMTVNGETTKLVMEDFTKLLSEITMQTYIKNIESVQNESTQIEQYIKVMSNPNENYIPHADIQNILYKLKQPNQLINLIFSSLGIK